jgi:hypothetical protein
MFDADLFGMMHGLKKFLGKCDLMPNLVFRHRMWKSFWIAFSELESLVQNAQGGCLREAQLLTRAFA